MEKLSVILTGSQLIFVKEPTWALALAEQINRLTEVGGLTPGHLLSPRFNDFRPDEVFSLGNTAAVYDKSFIKASPCSVEIVGLRLMQMYTVYTLIPPDHASRSAIPSPSTGRVRNE